MSSSDEIRWKQFFENFEKVFKLLESYKEYMFENELEKAGYIHFYEMTMEHANKVVYAYLNAKGITVETPRQAIKEMDKLNMLNDQRVWFKAQNRKNLPFYIHNDELANELVNDIDHTYLPELKAFYTTLSEFV
ncbi:HI0074 family nucleotidyltransferase substrate-binding subunit [Tenuibacillus multivorans]|uniref:Nucleotidyltransferase substrate binding protein, HI0074 family n=1 Tax=Tenuibacillus multivorans TaxID=237069 RepID=A0A1H0FJ43_9BACI|nr:HI0074 family nucleotidyltransferase substrate-binding subunit [Tenuibacillus multivorans]GEL77686.1 nucleotidyltransferase [Tenuibacillus multivorans]SDN94636.1 nucleotidyltransferase substrate binding protein, HI0074 family [Tenuibacillus multivorans]